jgi:sulfur-oxidizing protein SoxZ
MAATRALVHVPPEIRAGQPFELRTTLAHPMETGYRRDGEGRLLPRQIVRRMEVFVNAEPAFAAELHPAIAANPFMAFSLVLAASARLEIRWTGDRDFSHTEVRELVVT